MFKFFVILLIIVIVIDAARVDSGLMMDYHFGNQASAGKTCSEMPNQIQPVFTSGSDFGYLEVQTASDDSGNCKVEYLADRAGINIKAEQGTVSDRWRIKSEKNVGDVMTHLGSDNNGYTMDN